MAALLGFAPDNRCTAPVCSRSSVVASNALPLRCYVGNRRVSVLSAPSPSSDCCLFVSSPLGRLVGRGVSPRRCQSWSWAPFPGLRAKPPPWPDAARRWRWRAPPFVGCGRLLHLIVLAGAAPSGPWLPSLSSVQSAAHLQEGESSSSLPGSPDSRWWSPNSGAPWPSSPRSSVGRYRVRQCAF